MARVIEDLVFRSLLHAAAQVHHHHFISNVLGVKPTDDATTIKRAYRKLMSEHHPDKLVAKGLPPEMMEMAKQKAQEIQQAYELIKQQKGFK